MVPGTVSQQRQGLLVHGPIGNVQGLPGIDVREGHPGQEELGHLPSLGVKFFQPIGDEVVVGVHHVAALPADVDGSIVCDYGVVDTAVPGGAEVQFTGYQEGWAVGAAVPGDEVRACAGDEVVQICPRFLHLGIGEAGERSKGTRVFEDLGVLGYVGEVRVDLPEAPHTPLARKFFQVEKSDIVEG